MRNLKTIAVNTMIYTGLALVFVIWGWWITNLSQGTLVEAHRDVLKAIGVF